MSQQINKDPLSVSFQYCFHSQQSTDQWLLRSIDHGSSMASNFSAFTPRFLFFFFFFFHFASLHGKFRFYDFHVSIFALFRFRTLNSLVFAVSAEPYAVIEDGYKVTTVIDGHKLGISPYAVMLKPGSSDLVVLDYSRSAFYTVPFPVSKGTGFELEPYFHFF